MKLTNLDCKNTPPNEPPSKSPKKLADGNGLYLWIMPNNRRYWRFRYKDIKGKYNEYAIGVYPEISLAEAREKTREARALLRDGIDPNKHKKSLKRQRQAEAGNTYELIAREWHSHKKSEWTPDHAQNIMARLEKDVFPVLGDIPIREITHTDLLNVAKRIQERGANELAKRIIQLSVHIFQYAVITSRADKNIAEDLKGLIKPKPKSHYAAIEARDLPEFLRVLRSNQARLYRQTQLGVEMLMLTFVRTSELIKAEWSEFDFKEKEWIIPAKRMKMNRDHVVPLSRQTISILEELRELHGHPKYVFPSQINRNNHMSNNTILMSLKRMGYKGKMTGHGFRSLAMSTIMERLGYRHEVPDLQLAHAKRGDVARAYDRAQFMEERTKMMQEWADYLDSLYQTGEVVQFKRV